MQALQGRVARKALGEGESFRHWRQGGQGHGGPEAGREVKPHDMRSGSKEWASQTSEPGREKSSRPRGGPGHEGRLTGLFP